MPNLDSIKLCIPIRGDSPKEMMRKMDTSPEADIFEIWLDSLKTPWDVSKKPLDESMMEKWWRRNIKEIVRHKKKPLIFVNKDEKERGSWKGSEKSRTGVLRQAALCGAEYIDIGVHAEKKWIKNVKADAKRSGLFMTESLNGKSEHLNGKSMECFSKIPQWIISFHDFSGQPREKELKKIVEKMWKLGADIIKIAVTPRSTADLKSLYSLACWMRKKRKKYIVAGMGKYGKITRIFAEQFGSCIVYGARRKKEATAPGQLTGKELRMIWSIIQP
ncbi:type I 3-dehydroquinate dehydratase [Candidatus Peregrinibacteria bacterium]|nr:type I 3-dehydroquinate dehydratase [Candidatus Peregrinibacteria bacterium]